MRGPRRVHAPPRGTRVRPPAGDPAGQRADLVQVDGARVLTFGGKSADGRLRILDTSGGRLTPLGSLLAGVGDADGDGRPDAPEDQSLLLLPRHRALLLGSVPDYDTAPAAGSIESMIQYDTGLTLVDLSDAAHPVVLRSDRIEGQVLSAYEHDGVVRVAFAAPAGVRYSPARDGETKDEARERNLAAARAAAGKDWLPTRVTRDGTGKVTFDGPLLGCSDVTIPERPAGLGIASVLTIDAAGEHVATDPGTAVGVAAAADAAYFSARRVYLGTTEHGADAETRRVLGETTLYAFDATRRDASPRVASGTLPGLVSGPAAFSERDGRLRVVLGPDADTAAGNEGKSADRRGAAVLAEEGDRLRLLGAVAGAGKGDAVHDVTWLGDLALVRVGYDDPTYRVLDLADPAQPKVAGTLPSWVRALQPAGEHLLLARGYAASGLSVDRARLGFLDLRDPARPRLVGAGRVTAPLEVRSGPPVTFAWLPEARVAFVPVPETEPVGPPQCPLLNGRPACAREIHYVLAVRVDGEGRLLRAGRFDAGDFLRRLVAVGDDILVVGDGSLRLVDGAGLRVLDRLDASSGAVREK